MLIDRIAPTSMPVLILGETGAGKEHCAEQIHARSERRDRPFVRINCAAIAEGLLESELFGHERGAFTGAETSRHGLLETADGGTALLDEIGDVSARLQVKLLRALERGQLARVGSATPRHIDVRFIAATNRDLGAMVAGGRFRADLYYRLAGVVIAIPPLRERVSEIAPLARRFAAELSPSDRVPLLSSDAVAALRDHRWPGNVRELRNAIARAVALCDGGPVLPEHLGLAGVPGGDRDDPRRRELLAVLLEHGWNQTRAARELGVARGTLRARMDALGLKRPQS